MKSEKEKDHIIDDNYTCDIDFTKGTYTETGVDFNCQTLTSIAEIVYLYVAETKHKDQSVKKAH